MEDEMRMVKKFISIGLSEQKAKETTKNGGLTNTLNWVIEEAKKFDRNDGIIDKTVGKLLYIVATTIKAQINHHIPLVISYIATEKIDSELKLKEALNYLLENPNAQVDLEKFELAAGVGIQLTADDVKKTVHQVIEKYREEIANKRYQFNVGIILSEAKSCLKFADGKQIKTEVDAKILDLLGPRTEDDKKPVSKKPTVVKKNDPESADGAQTIAELMKNKVHFHKPGENFKTEGYIMTPNTMDLLKEHLKGCNNKVRTRFPPEPNGILHIGHAKAININFGYAKAHDGVCILRYDDTNPEKEEEKFVTGIKDMVEWLGYKPYKITHSSDNFDKLFELAIRLIKKGLAYVCHQKQDEIKGFNPPPSPWRDRPVEENLKLFEEMRSGLIGEGEATLRMKVTLEEGKQDPVAYRIKFVPHHNTGDKWCIYPTYDYTHCICDSIENITHSLCTKEFQSRRSSYYWLCNALDIYCPVQWEYGRLNVNYTVVSKRKIAKLIAEGVVNDWDDPRLFTLTALRRRGFPAEAINNFCAQMGVTGSQSSVDPSMLEAAVRDVLNNSAPRTMAVLEPLKIVIKNFKSFYKTSTLIDVPDYPSDPNKPQTHKIIFDEIIYIERSDFKINLDGDSDFRRLTPNQPVGLRHVGLIIKVVDMIKNNDQVDELHVEAYRVDKTKPNAFIHWVSSPLNCEVRLYERLFNHKNPEDPNEVPNGFISDCNLNSLKIMKNAFVDLSVKDVNVFDNFQFERIGYFSVDTDSKADCLVFNRTVSLKESSGKH